MCSMLYESILCVKYMSPVCAVYHDVMRGTDGDRSYRLFSLNPTAARARATYELRQLAPMFGGIFVKNDRSKEV